MKSIAIIPVRMGSTRFPGKPLKKINGIPMVELIYKLISKNKSLSKVSGRPPFLLVIVAQP